MCVCVCVRERERERDRRYGGRKERAEMNRLLQIDWLHYKIINSQYQYPINGKL